VKLRTSLFSLAGLALLLGLFLAGCACPPPPCDTDVADIEAARVQADQAHQALIAQAAADKAELEKQVAALESQLRTEADYQALVERLEDLKCGSGR